MGGVSDQNGTVPVMPRFGEQGSKISDGVLHELVYCVGDHVVDIAEILPEEFLD